MAARGTERFGYFLERSEFGTATSQNLNDAKAVPSFATGSGRALLRFFGSMSAEEAQEMAAVIEQE